ncbi:MAG: DUF4157 domain-containing protein [Bermanella sp.]|jgi:hypothetical protein
MYQREDKREDKKEALAVQRKNNTGLPNNVKAGIEHLSGMNMDHVKVHYNSPKPAQLNAHAYAQGSDIHMAPGQNQHIAHEAWHVVQQAQGRVAPTTQFAGQAINDNQALETEADVMGDKAASIGRSLV